MTDIPRVRRRMRRLERQGRRIRSTWKGQAMSTETATTLLGLARKQYGAENARLAILVRVVAIEKVVDNARDAHDSIRRLLGEAREPQERVSGR